MKRILALLTLLFLAAPAQAIQVNGYLSRAALENASSDPTTTLTGRVYWNTTQSTAKIYTGSAWIPLGSGGMSAAYTQAPTTAITAVGGANSPLGHTIDTKDFATTKEAFWNNFSASNLTDNAGTLNCSSGTAACALTNTSSAVTFGNTGILGASTAASFNGTSAELVCSDSFCKPGSNYAAYYAWIKPTAWAPASSQAIFGQYDAGGNRAMELYLHPSAGLVLNVYQASQVATCSISYPVTGLSGWHHVAAVIDSTNLKCYVYIDGKGLSASMAAAMYASTTSLKIGSEGATSGIWYSGLMEQIGIVNGYLMTADDIRKLAARRLDHNLAIDPMAQLFLDNYERSDGQIYQPEAVSNHVVSKSSNSLWLDYSDLPVGSYYGYRLFNTGSSPNNVPLVSYDSGWLQSAPSTTIPHGLGSIPGNVRVQYVTNYGATGAAQTYDGGQYCSADSTNLYCDWTGFAVSSSNQIRVMAWLDGTQVAVQAASTTSSGIIRIKAPTQTIYTSGSGTYTVPAGVTWLRVRMVGGGGGGAGSGSTGASDGGAGGNTTFGTSLLVANGGTGGRFGSSTISAGGTASLGSAVGIAVQGQTGYGFQTALATGTANVAGGYGGSTPLGGGGTSSAANPGTAAMTNSGSGGGGAGYSAAGGVGYSGSGGAAGGFVDAVISSLSTTYSYAVGAAGSGGTAGTGGGAGGAGAAGQIIIEEHYY